MELNQEQQACVDFIRAEWGGKDYCREMDAGRGEDQLSIEGIVRQLMAGNAIVYYMKHIPTVDNQFGRMEMLSYKLKGE